MGNLRRSARRAARRAARCLLVACVGLPAVAGCGEAFADERITVTVETGPGPAEPTGPRTEVHTGRVHVVYHPGVVTSVRLGDDVAVTVRPGCGCPTEPPPPTATRPPPPPPPPPSRPRPSAPAPTVTKATERAPVAPTPTRPPPAAPARPYIPVVLIRPVVPVVPLPRPPSPPASVAERPPTPRPVRIAAAPPDDDPSPPGFADGIGPALIVSILPAALAALLPHPGRRGARS
ncbi:hypothetical protein [Embleya sp. NPDC050493]|uniref:hypothetical protein n=1 Tax=Embleya sp. NPDC050493 TaxID=3363989 RepID=UPI0037A400ED